MKCPKCGAYKYSPTYGCAKCGHGVEAKPAPRAPRMDPETVDIPGGIKLTPDQEDLVLRRKLISHARALRWAILRLRHLDRPPQIMGVRVDSDEWAVITKVLVLHNPRAADILGG